MTEDKITYGESIECPGRWRRMDYETTVKERETEFEAGIRAEKFVQNFLSKEQTPQNGFISPELDGKAPQFYTSKPSQSIENQPEEKISPEQQEQNLIEEIEQATTENLHTFKIAAAQNIRTLGAYNKRKKQLNIA